MLSLKALSPLLGIVGLSVGLGACRKDEPAPVCDLTWTTGTPAFRDASDNWGLPELAAEGVRLNVLDFDNDGWPDLLVRHALNASDDFAGNVRHTWLLRNTGNGRFEDVTQSSGLLAMRTDTSGNHGRPGQVIAAADVDNDGDLDVYTGLYTYDPAVALGETSELMLNNGDGTFSFGPADSEVRRVARVDAPAGAAFVDTDLDGNVDLWVPQADYISAGAWYLVQNRLYRGDGTGRLNDATEAAGLTTASWNNTETINAGLAHSRSWGATACDLNDDGLAELMVPSYGRAPNHLWQATGSAGSVTYLNRSVDSGYAYDSNFDYHDDENFLCYCSDHPTDADCLDAQPPSLESCDDTYWDPATDTQPFRLGGNSASTFCADINNDGALDLLTGEIKHWWPAQGADESQILVNTGAYDVALTRLSDQEAGLSIPHPQPDWDEGHMTQAVFDFDNDGWPDILQGASDYPDNRSRLYHQTSPLKFEEVPKELGIDHNRSHGMVFADFDRDGDLDVVIGHSRARCGYPGDSAPCYPNGQLHIFENLRGNLNNWLQLELEGGAGTNRAAIGARVTVTACGFTQTQEVGGGFGHYGAQNDRVLHFGIGATKEAEVTIRWPNAFLTRQSLTLKANQRYRVVQNQTPTADGP